MANIVTKDSFTGRINIDTNTTAIQSKLNSFIGYSENGFIAMLFGENAVSWMNTEMLKVGISNELKAFRDGGTFLYSDGKTYTLKGLIAVLASYIYFDYIQDTTFNTPVGNAQLDVSNGQQLIDRVKICSIYNDAIRESIKLHGYVETYPTFFQSDIEQNIPDVVNHLGI